MFDFQDELFVFKFKILSINFLYRFLFFFSNLQFIGLVAGLANNPSQGLSFDLNGITSLSSVEELGIPLFSIVTSTLIWAAKDLEGTDWEEWPAQPEPEWCFFNGSLW